jgi:hypothetical protein
MSENWKKISLIIQGCFFFFFQFCDAASHIGDHPQEELAEFGYRSDRKAKTSFKILLQFWLPA